MHSVYICVYTYIYTHMYIMIHTQAHTWDTHVTMIRLFLKSDGPMERSAYATCHPLHCHTPHQTWYGHISGRLHRGNSLFKGHWSRRRNTTHIVTYYHGWVMLGPSVYGGSHFYAYFISHSYHISSPIIDRKNTMFP